MSDRIVKTQRWDDEIFSSLPANSKLLFVYLSDRCDEGGFWEVSMKKVKLDLEPLTNEQIKQSFKDIESRYLLSIDRKILLLRNFCKVQYTLPLKRTKIEHREAIKAIDYYQDRFDFNILKMINKDKSLDPLPFEEADLTKRRPKFIKPTIEEIKLIIKDPVLAQKFFNHYTSNGWVVGKSKMVDWQASANNWKADNTKPEEKKGRVITF